MNQKPQPWLMILGFVLVHLVGIAIDGRETVRRMHEFVVRRIQPFSIERS